MKKTIKFIYWLMMSCMFLLLLYREKKMSGQNEINIKE